MSSPLVPVAVQRSSPAPLWCRVIRQSLVNEKNQNNLDPSRWWAETAGSGGTKRVKVVRVQTGDGGCQIGHWQLVNFLHKFVQSPTLITRDYVESLLIVSTQSLNFFIFIYNDSTYHQHHIHVFCLSSINDRQKVSSHFIQIYHYSTHPPHNNDKGARDASAS